MHAAMGEEGKRKAKKNRQLVNLEAKKLDSPLLSTQSFYWCWPMQIQMLVVSYDHFANSAQK